MPPDGRMALAEKMDYTSPESVMVTVVVTLAVVLIFALPKKVDRD
jgi:hypothetical protein